MFLLSSSDWSVKAVETGVEGRAVGQALAAPGDLNADGVPDLLMSAPLTSGSFRAPCGLYDRVQALSYVGVPSGSTTWWSGCGGAKVRTYGGAPPSLGNPGFGLAPLGGPPNASAWFVIGSNTASYAGVTLPMSLASLGLPTCALLVAPDLILQSTTGPRGDAFLPIPIAASPSLSGAVAFIQAASPGPPAAFSEGLRLVGVP